MIDFVHENIRFEYRIIFAVVFIRKVGPPRCRIWEGCESDFVCECLLECNAVVSLLPLFLQAAGFVRMQCRRLDLFVRDTCGEYQKRNLRVCRDSRDCSCGVKSRVRTSEPGSVQEGCRNALLSCAPD